MQKLLDNIKIAIEQGKTFDIVVESSEVCLSLFDQEIISALQIKNILHLECINGCFRIPVEAVVESGHSKYTIITESNLTVTISTT